MNFNILGGLRKMNIFGGYADFMDMFWWSLQIGLVLGVISVYFRVFS